MVTTLLNIEPVNNIMPRKPKASAKGAGSAKRSQNEVVAGPQRHHHSREPAASIPSCKRPQDSSLHHVQLSLFPSQDEVAQHGHDCGQTRSHDIRAHTVDDIYTWIVAHLNLPIGSFELLCQGVLLSHSNGLALPSPVPSGGPLRIQVLRYSQPGPLSATASSGMCSDASDEEDHDVREYGANGHAGSEIAEREQIPLDDGMITPSSAMMREKADMLANLAGMFAEMAVGRLADVVAACSTIEDAVDMALALNAVADEPATEDFPNGAGKELLGEHGELISFDRAKDEDTLASLEMRMKKKKKKKRKKGGKEEAGEEAAWEVSQELATLIDMFPDHSPAALTWCLRRHDGKVDPAIEELIGISGRQDEQQTLPKPKSAAALSNSHPPPGLSVRNTPVTRSVSVPNLTASTKEIPSSDFNFVGPGRNRTRVNGIAHANSFDLLATPKAAKQAIRAAATQAAAAQAQRNAPKAPGIRVVATASRRERQYRSEAAIHGDTAVLDPLPGLRRQRVATAAAAPAGAHLTHARTALGAELEALHAQRARRFDQAKQALKCGKLGTARWKLGGQVAGMLAEDGHALTDAIRDVEKRAALALIRERQSDAVIGSAGGNGSENGNGYSACNGNAAVTPARTVVWLAPTGSNHIDLHGLNVRQAKLAAAELLDAWYAEETAQSPRPQRPLFVVVGLGKHSHGAHKLGPAISAMLRREGYRYIDESALAGRFVVTDRIRD